MNFSTESIFVSSIRAFFKSLFIILGIFVAIVVVAIAISTLSQPDVYPAKSEMTILPDANGDRKLLPETSPVILCLDFKGVIGSGDITLEKIEDLLLDSREGFFKGNRIKGILLRMNTPGGTANDSDGIYRAIVAYKKKYNIPVVAYIQGLCASGGMYIVSSADQIYATSSSTIGSVGVILGPAFNFSQAMEKYGIQAKTITEGKDKDMLNPFRPWIPGEDQSIVNVTKALYDEFVDIVTAARPNLNKEKLINEYGAQVFAASKAQDLGYIDEANASYGSALSALTKLANLSENTLYQVVLLEPVHSFFSELAQGQLALLSGKITHSFQFGSFMNSDFSGKFLYLYEPQ